MKKRNYKPLFSPEEIKKTIIDIKIDQNTKEHLPETVQIPERPVICKKCNYAYISSDSKLYKCYSHENRVVSYCPKCTTINKIKKVLSFPERY